MVEDGFRTGLRPDRPGHVVKPCAHCHCTQIVYYSTHVMHNLSARQGRHSRQRKTGKSTLGRLFGSEARAKILTALLLGPDAQYYVRDLAHRLGLPPTAVSREL